MTPSASVSRPRIGRAWFHLALAAVLAGIAGSASGQGATYKPILKPKGYDAAKQAAAQAMINAGAVTDEKLLQDYFVSMLADLSDPKKDKNMHKIRADIKKQLQTAAAAPIPTAHDKANALLVKGLPTLVVKTTLHPAVRYNCALLLADLDSVEKQGQANPVPLPAALDKLLELLANQKAHDSARLGALVGVTRHAALVENAANRERIAKATLSFLDELDKADGQARKRDMKSWFEFRAMEALGSTVAPNPEVVAALQARLGDASRPLWVRSAAAVSLGKLKYEATSQVDAAALLASYKSLVDTAVDQAVTRRELREVLFSVKRGLAGDSDPAPNALVTMFTEAQKNEATQMVNAMSKMAEICDSATIKGEARVANEIQKIVVKWRAGEFSDKLDADAKANLEEDATSGEEVAPDGVEFPE